MWFIFVLIFEFEQKNVILKKMTLKKNQKKFWTILNNRLHDVGAHPFCALKCVFFYGFELLNTDWAKLLLPLLAKVMDEQIQWDVLSVWPLIHKQQKFHKLFPFIIDKTRLKK